MLGTWRITDMEVWDADYFDMEVAAHVTIHNDLTGEFQFGLVQGDIDAPGPKAVSASCCKTIKRLY